VRHSRALKVPRKTVPKDPVPKGPRLMLTAMSLNSTPGVRRSILGPPGARFLAARFSSQYLAVSAVRPGVRGRARW